MAEPAPIPEPPEQQPGDAKPGVKGPVNGLLTILGALAVGYGLLIRQFQCFMVVDSSCSSRVEPMVVIPLAIGGALILLAIVRKVRARR